MTFLCATCGFKQGDEGDYVAHGVKDCLRRLSGQREKFRSVAQLVDYTDRSRGYPMPEEWKQVVRAAKEALNSEG